MCWQKMMLQIISNVNSSNGDIFFVRARKICSFGFCNSSVQRYKSCVAKKRYSGKIPEGRYHPHRMTPVSTCQAAVKVQY